MGIYIRAAARKRKSLIDQANENALFTTVPKATSTQEKRDLVVVGNPLFYTFGYTLVPRNGMDYADYLAKLGY